MKREEICRTNECCDKIWEIEQKKQEDSNMMSSEYIDPGYRFENFVIGRSNQVAYAACMAVANSQEGVLNPLYIYGETGLGKTHLMHSIGHYIIENNKNMKVLYVTLQEFTNEVIESIRQEQSNSNVSSMTKFREKYRNIDVLLFDDIDFIIGKEATQKECFNIIASLYSAGKTIVMSSCKHPKENAAFYEKFYSEFETGFIVNIQSPDYDTRTAILMKYAETLNKEIPYEVIEYIANNIKSSVRELEGAFNKVNAFSMVNQNRAIDMELAKEALKR